MDKLKLSSIIVAKNEENNIGRCIDSQMDCIDEIIVMIDASSTDKTEEIVKSKKVTYYSVKWQGYAKTKQLALEKTSNNWVLWIDADESLTPEIKAELNAFKYTSPKYAAYSVARRAFFLNKWIKHSGWYPARVTRLFDKSKARFNDNNVHENLVVDGETGKLANDLNHWTDPTIEHYLKKFNEYTSLAAKDLYEKGKPVSVIDLILRPFLMFLKMYFIKLGFLDGVHGFILAVFSSAYVFTKYTKLWHLKKNN
ncbi:MAG: glycosyltransferase family 2 protein [Ignavibacteriales bacterium]|nr:MAG: glycosyltransferase family 2 protein [Ignavibacteriales bacterium]